MPENHALSGIIIINKPVGITSFQAVARIRKLLGVRKVGHCGTLDPFASGVLPICVGRATRVIRYMDVYDKAYRCTVRFGAFTDTQDREGKVIGGDMPSGEELLKLESEDFRRIRSLFSALPGEREQLPPMYSAIKIGGHPLYEYARKGISVERSARPIRIYDCILHDIWADESLHADFSVSCSKGTYIRTICNELGVQSGYGAYADALCRTACGPFSLKEAFTLEDIEALYREGRTAEFLLSEDLAIGHLPRIDVTSEEAFRIRQGQQMDFRQFEDRIRLTGTGNERIGTHIRAYCGERLVAIVLPDDKEGRRILRIERMLA